MKFETLMLHGLFAASLLICALTLGAMLTSHAAVASVAGGHLPVVAAAIHAAG